MKRYFRIAEKILTYVYELPERIIDSIRLRKKYSQLKNFSRVEKDVRKELFAYYRKYLSNISSKDMAISLELSVFLIIVCRILKPKRILDLGSGFSSFIFRYYAANTVSKPVILSVNDSNH